MKLIPKWEAVVMRSHSMRAQYLSLACLIGPEVAFWLLGYDVASPRLWWGLAVVFSLYGIFGRIKDQGLAQ
jgi:lysozyme